METKYSIYDIIQYNAGDVFTVGIVTRIIINGYESTHTVQYYTDREHYVNEENVVRVLGNAVDLTEPEVKS